MDSRPTDTNSLKHLEHEVSAEHVSDGAPAPRLHDAIVEDVEENHWFLAEHLRITEQIACFVIFNFFGLTNGFQKMTCPFKKFAPIRKGLAPLYLILIVFVF